MVKKILTAFLFIVVLFLAAASVHSQSRYKYSAIGDEVTDTKTGLIWRRCSEGQVWDGYTCSGGGAIYTHEQALIHAASQAGAMGWRLPNVKELASIVDKTSVYPAIDSVAFPETPLMWSWSSTPCRSYPCGDNFAWFVYFTGGGVSYSVRTNSAHIRLVR